jgi:hypothetical protein
MKSEGPFPLGSVFVASCQESQSLTTHLPYIRCNPPRPPTWYSFEEVVQFCGFHAGALLATGPYFAAARLAPSPPESASASSAANGNWQSLCLESVCGMIALGLVRTVVGAASKSVLKATAGDGWKQSAAAPARQYIVCALTAFWVVGVHPRVLVNALGFV